MVRPQPHELITFEFDPHIRTALWLIGIAAVILVIRLFWDFIVRERKKHGR